jgi:intein/homing endonuclease
VTYSLDGGFSWTSTNEEDTLILPVGTLLYSSGFICTGDSSSNPCSESNYISYTSNFWYGSETEYITISGVETNYCSWYCFTEETMILTYDKKKKKKRLRRIKELKKGDYVYTFNEKTKKYEVSKIKNIEVVKSKKVYAIKFANGEVIRCSSGHRFYVEGMDYMMACEIRKGYKILGMDNKNYEIIDINLECYDKEVELYNIYLEKNNNLFVSTMLLMSYALTASVALVSDPQTAFASPC